MMSQPRLVNRMGAGRWLLLLVLVAGGLGLLRAQDAFAVPNPSLGSFQFSSATFDVTEGTQADIVVTRTGGAGPYCLNYTLFKSGDTAVAGVDYSNTSGCLSFTANGTSTDTTKHIAVATLHNATFGAGDRTLTVRLSPDSNVVFGSPIDTTLTIRDIDGPPSFTFTPTGYTTNDVSTTVQVTVTRTGGTGVQQQVSYSTIAGTATAGTDYTGIAPTVLPFAASAQASTSNTFLVTILNNRAITGNKTFSVHLTAASNSGSMGPDGTITINDTDGPGTFQFTSSTFAGAEGTTAQLQISRTGGNSGAATLTCTVTGGTAITAAVAGQDIMLPSSGTTTTVAFGDADPGPHACSVPILSDGLSEPTETAVFGLSVAGAGSVSGQTTTTLNVLDIGGAGAVAFSSPTYSVAENAGNLLITVQRSTVTGGQTVQYSTSDGTALAGIDYTTAVGQLAFAQGDSAKSFSVAIIDNTIVNPSKNFTVTLSTPSAPGTLGSPSTATVTITDNEVGVPTITSVTPNAGAPAGGTVVTLTGTGFVGVTGVKFGGVVASFTPPSDPTTLVAVAPGGTAGTIVDITVTTPLGTNTNTTADDYSYTNGPIITGVSPGTGPTGATTLVTITGQNFSGLLSVTFGNTTALNCTNPSSTQIICQTPTTIPAGTVDIRVTTTTAVSPISPSDQFTFTGAGGSIPTVTFLNPATGAAGAVAPGAIVITGTNFTAGSTVMFGSAPGTGVTFGSSTSLTVTPPARTLAGSVEVVVTTAAGSSATADTANDYTYTAAGMPTITTLAPTSTPINTAGTSVLITGTNFVAGASTVTFGGVAATVTVSTNTTSLTVTAPSSSTPGPVEVVVTTAVGSNTTVGTQNDFTYTGVIPTITSLTPSSGGAGTSVVINGTNFTGATSVTFGGVAATSFTVNDAQNITATVPSGVALGAVEVIVTTPSGANVTTGTQNDFTFGSGATATYQLFFVWNLIVYTGKNNYDVFDAIRGVETPANALTNDISAQVTAIFRWSPNGVGCTGGLPQCWLGWFPNGVGVPGANDFTTLQNGVAYWIAVKANVNWTILIGP